MLETKTYIKTLVFNQLRYSLNLKTSLQKISKPVSKKREARRKNSTTAQPNLRKYARLQRKAHSHKRII